MNSKKAAPFEKAKAYAFLLLKYRLRSEQELTERLRRKGFAADVVDRAVAFLKEKRFIDDREFARQWVAGRLASRIGAYRIMRELRLKGVKPSLIRQELDEASAGRREAETIDVLIEQQCLRQKQLDARALQRRLYGFLMRRGFAADAIIDALNRRFNPLSKISGF